MKFGPTLLLLGAVLIATSPIRADGMPHPGLAKQSPNVLLVDRFDSNKASDVWDSQSSAAPETLFSAPSDANFHRARLIDFNFHEGKTGSPKDRGHDWDRHHDGGNQAPTPIPEPGSFSLLLLGLAGVGLLAQGRAVWTKSN